MTTEELKKALKEEVRPVKELVEVMKKTIDRLEFSQRVTGDQVRTIKEQQSVINEKLDDVKKDLEEVQQTTESNSGSLIEIETTLKSYADAYKLNQDNIERLKKKVNKVEEHLGLPIE